MKRIYLLLTSVCALLATGCWHAQFFTLSWDEEVRLHSGEIITVHLDSEYERLDRLSEYGSAILRTTMLRLDAGPPFGVVTQRFERQRPIAIDKSNDGWFVVLSGRATRLSAPPGQDWGPDQNGNGQRVVKLINGRFRPVPIDSLPAWLVSANLLVDYAPVQELAKFQGTKVDLDTKMKYVQTNPLAPTESRIDRPRH